MSPSGRPWAHPNTTMAGPPISSAETCLVPAWASIKARQRVRDRPVNSNMSPALTCPSQVTVVASTRDSPPYRIVEPTSTCRHLEHRTVLIRPPASTPHVRVEPPPLAARIASFHEGMRGGFRWLGRHIILSPHLHNPTSTTTTTTLASGRARRSRSPPTRARRP
jgi:hypothetical protein